MSPIARTTQSPTQPVETAKVVAAIIAHGLNLQPGRVMLDYERWQVPKDGLFIVVGYLGDGEQVATSSAFQPGDESEVQSAYTRETLQIDLMSIIPDNSARLRRWEVPLSLQSFYARNYAARYGVGLPPIQQPMQDTTKLEAGGMVNRFTLRTPVFSTQSRTIPAGFFDHFTATLDAASASGPQPPKNISLEAP